MYFSLYQRHGEGLSGKLEKGPGILNTVLDKGECSASRYGRK
jgi:hypothetical protein